MGKVIETLVSSSTQVSVEEERLKAMEAKLVKLKEQQKQEEEELQKIADSMSLLVSTDDDLMDRYETNMAAFKEFYPEIYDFFTSYQPQKSVIDTANGFINSHNTETDKYLYDYPSYLVTKKQFDGFCQSPNIKKFNFNSADENEANFIHVKYLDQILGLLPDKKLKLTESAKSLSTLVVFGVGAGYHLEMISQRYDIACINIVEPDLDLFFLSLFSINWQMVLDNFDQKGARVFISLGDQKNVFFDDFMREAARSGRYQQSHVAGYIHYHSQELSEIIAEFNRRYLEIGQGWGFFDDAVMSISHMLSNLSNQVPLLRKSAINENEVADIPVFIVGNGPSLDNLIETIKRYQDKAIVISCGSALSALYKYGIKPDFHCEQERTFPVAEKITLSCPSSFLDDVVLLAPTIVHPAVFTLFEHSIMIPKMSEPATVLLMRDEIGKENFSGYHYINPTVANTALVAGYNLGFKNFYLFGIDLGHKKEGLHHSKNSLYYDEQQIDRELYDVNKDKLMNVKGNFDEQVLCDSFFYQSNRNLSHQIVGFNDLNCFNLSDGAFIEGSVPFTKGEMTNLFDERSAFNKLDIAIKMHERSTFNDKEAALHQRLVEHLDYDFFDIVCSKFIELNSKPIESFKDATDLLLDNTTMLRSTNEQVNDLLIGTMMHIQVALTHLLYGYPNKEEGLSKFREGLVLYCQFLHVAPQYYRENAETVQSVENTKWISKLRESSTR